MQQIVNGLNYDTEKADLVAHDRYFDGSNWERHGRNTYLYRTKAGRFFLHHTTLWQPEPAVYAAGEGRAQKTVVRSGGS